MSETDSIIEEIRQDILTKKHRIESVKINFMLTREAKLMSRVIFDNLLDSLDKLQVKYGNQRR